jgi:hypothetical protein
MSTNQGASGICPTSLRQLFLAGASLIALSGSTLAADLPVRKAPPPAVMASWAGFYATAGSATNFPSRRRPTSRVLSPSTASDRKFGPVVTGLEIDFSVRTSRAATACPTHSSYPVSDRRRSVKPSVKTSSISAAPAHVSAGCPQATSCSMGPRVLRGNGSIKRETVLRSSSSSDNLTNRFPVPRGLRPTNSAGSRA